MFVFNRSVSAGGASEAGRVPRLNKPQPPSKATANSDEILVRSSKPPESLRSRHVEDLTESDLSAAVGTSAGVRRRSRPELSNTAATAVDSLSSANFSTPTKIPSNNPSHGTLPPHPSWPVVSPSDEERLAEGRDLATVGVPSQRRSKYSYWKGWSRVVQRHANTILRQFYDPDPGSERRVGFGEWGGEIGEDREGQIGVGRIHVHLISAHKVRLPVNVLQSRS